MRIYDWPSGIAKFFRMSLGGALIGIAFGIGLIVLLYLLNRRLNVEENVIQITATSHHRVPLLLRGRRCGENERSDCRCRLWRSYQEARSQYD